MKKFIWAVTAAAVLGLLVCLSVRRTQELILQGEVDTKTVDLASKITGRVKKIHVREGDVVVPGQLLLELDLPEIEAQYARADAAVDLAAKTYSRQKPLSDQNIVSRQQLDEADSAYRSALSAQKEIRAYLDENAVKSPLDGRVEEIAVEEGELVGAGYPVISIVDDTDSWIVLNLREDLVAKIRIGSEFDVTIPALGGALLRVKVYYISAMGSYTTWRATKIRGDFDLKTFEVRARPLQPVAGLIAGMTAVVDWNQTGL